MVAGRVVAPARSAATGTALGLRLAVALVVLTLASLTTPAVTAAYGNLSAHPEINTLAFRAFERRAAADQWLSGTDLLGEKTSGIAVTVPGLLQIKEEEKTMTVTEWIAHGGMSADEPELPASFRHFYDPLANSKATYLTDHLDDAIEWSGTLGGALIQTAGYFMPTLDTKNPKIDAKTWALTHPDNRYSYANAIRYFREALAAPAVLDSDGQPMRTTAKYGMAWRAVGETMHLVADMTIPAHVRNDSHPDVDINLTKIGNPDPYESTIGAAEVAANAGGPASPSIDYGSEDLAELFDSLATWTNANFYSGDTIQSEGLFPRTANGELAYRSPSVPAAEGNYFYRVVDGAKTALLAKSLLSKFALLISSADRPVPAGRIDWLVLQAQRRALIPTAVAASSQVLDNFLPRFQAEFAVKQTGTKAFEITGSLTHNPTKTWPTAPAANNGAFLRYKPQNSDRVQVIWLPRESYESDNKIKHTLEVEPGGVVSLHWDLGGYVIKTQPAVLGGAELRISATGLDAALVKRAVKLEALVAGISAELKSVRIEWTFGDGSAPETAMLGVEDAVASHLVEYTYQTAGEFTITARLLHPATGALLAEMSCKTVVREVKVQIYPNALSGKIGFPVEASCLPSESYYRYEWSFGDGQSVTGGKSTVEHAYGSAGSYDLTVRVFDQIAPGPALAQDTIQVQIEGQQGECPLCGHVHGPLEKTETAKVIRYRDSKGNRQCVYSEYWDDQRTKLRVTSIYVDDVREGMLFEFYEDGAKKYETPYIADKRSGMQMEYNYLGQLTTEREYKDDRADGLYIGYYPKTGVKSTTGQYVYFADTKRTQQHGYWVSWHENGFKSDEGEYDRGEETGTWRFYYQTGQLEIEGAYAAGKSIGTWTWYNTKGEVMRTYTY